MNKLFEIFAVFMIGFGFASIATVWAFYQPSAETGTIAVISGAFHLLITNTQNGG